MMKRIKYVSRFAKPLTSSDIEALTVQSAEKNKALDITGVLMTSGGMFFQIIEGPSDNVDQLYEEIVKDDRHQDVLALNIDPDVSTRLFPDWSMKQVDLDVSSSIRAEPLKAILEAVIRQREILESISNALERGIWNELTKAGL